MTETTGPKISFWTTSSFGAPEIEVDVENDVIKEIRVSRGAPCGATWLAAEKVKGMKVEDAIVRFGLEVQFGCSADPPDGILYGGKARFMWQQTSTRQS